MRKYLYRYKKEMTIKETTTTTGCSTGLPSQRITTTGNRNKPAILFTKKTRNE
jgi:hypothetical protein